VRQQLELWPPRQPSMPNLPPWETIHGEERALLVAALTRLMIKAVQPQQLSETREERHER